MNQPVTGRKTDLKFAEHERAIVLGGGCFWGTEAYLKRLPGVTRTFAAYVNGEGVDVDYRTVCSGETDHVEAVWVTYDPGRIDLPHLLYYFFKTIDPTQKDRQGPDVGRQYRSGVYYLDENDRPIIEDAIKSLQEGYQSPVVVEVLPLENITRAESEHQNYLNKNPGGYCHVSFATLPAADTPLTGDRTQPGWSRPDDKTLREGLSRLSYDVTQNDGTEAPYSSTLNDEWSEGIYVDIVSGEPLFSSRDKYDAGCGWPSFTRPIRPNCLTEREDYKIGYARTEVRSGKADSHLGHVFMDGPNGGTRFCINGAALRFIPKDKMKEEGYADYLNDL